MGSACTIDELKQINTLSTEVWEELVPITPLRPGYEETRRNYIKVVDNNKVFTHLRLNFFPDGGLARLRVFGVVDINFAGREKELIDLMAIQNGCVCTDYSNAHYGHPSNLIKVSRGKNMGDGWETARRLDRPSVLKLDEKGNLNVTGSEYAIFRLGAKGTVEKVVIDTNHFKGNFPDRIQIDGALVDEKGSLKWVPILTDFKVRKILNWKCLF